MQRSEVQSKKLGFLDLPVEIRLLIYQYYFVREQAYIVPLSSARLLPGAQDIDYGVSNLLLANKRIHDEAIGILYSKNWFQLRLHDDGAWFLSKAFNREQLDRVRKVRLIALSYGFSYGETLEGAFWAPFLAQLSHLDIVAVQPQQRGSSRNAELLNEDLEIWLKWIAHVAQFVSCYLPKESQLRVYDNGKKATKAIFEAFLSGPVKNGQDLGGVD